MGSNKLVRLFYTVKYLKRTQIYYRSYYFVKNRLVNSQKFKNPREEMIGLTWTSFLPANPTYSGNNTFTFLNQKKKFENKIDWNYATHGKLWVYNLNYFDFLNQKTITKEDGIALIDSYVQNEYLLKDGLEPYPISLRGINWIKFLAKHNIKNKKIDYLLYNHYHRLLKNLEYHLLGNHLLENGFSLLFGAYYFKEEVFYKSAVKNIKKRKLAEQILKDGGHFELSPMYHQILLNKILDAVSMLKNNIWKEDGLLDVLVVYGQRMLSWLETDDL